MERFLTITGQIFNVLGQIFRWLFQIIEAILSGAVGIVSEYPRFFALLLGVIAFMYCLQNVQGFGEAVASIIALLVIIWLTISMMMPSGKKKKR